ncbi:tetratricopeptide repeat protein [Mariniradius sediminis]|uniref:Tetratricopeptide repeat protein n=1 Tax=Mariniradius sediminis TaxID=2909237 RepID=A0ABS9BU80_9BACT|nr:tetratricopeptide repeat protein [Mariniradius sediminis]
MKNLIKLLIPVLFSVSLLACDSPEDKKGRFLLKGNEKLNQNDAKAAIDFYTEALNIDDQYRDALFNRALVYQQLNQLDLAIRDLDAILTSNPTDSLAVFQRGVCLLDNGEYYKALGDTKNLLKINPESWKGHFLQGLIYEKMKNLEEARSSFLAALQKSPNNVEILVNLANMEYYLGNLEIASNLLDKAEKIDPSEANILNLRSLLALETKEYKQALIDIEKAIVLRPNEAYYYNNRGLYKLLLGDLDAGLEDINYSIKQYPKNLFAIRNKGIYYALKGQKELALRYLNEVKEKDPNMMLVDEYLKIALNED